jgi:small subunit ribosomal protein S2
VNLVGDKQFTEVAEVEPPAELVTLNATGEGEEIGDVVDLEAALGGGIRKAPGVVSALEEERETAETAL